VSSLARAIATLGGVGYARPAPGTWGSAMALPLAWLIHTNFGAIGLFFAAGLVFALGCWAAGAHIRATGRDDPPEVVIDEVAGQFLVLAPAAVEPLPYLIGFLAFRLLDIWKPWPARWADQHVHGGLGAMLDDLLAAGYGCIAMAAWMWLR
jgi:phosphatidylglycerophosphatase A